MVIGPAELVKEYYDIVFVDESHRLRRRVNLGSYFHSFDVVCEKLAFDKNSCSELDWVIKNPTRPYYFMTKTNPSNLQTSNKQISIN